VKRRDGGTKGRRRRDGDGGTKGRRGRRGRTRGRFALCPLVPLSLDPFVHQSLIRSICSLLLRVRLVLRRQVFLDLPGMTIVNGSTVRILPESGIRQEQER
jgi:hypothetical protein